MKEKVLMKLMNSKWDLDRIGLFMQIVITVCYLIFMYFAVNIVIVPDRGVLLYMLTLFFWCGSFPLVIGLIHLFSRRYDAVYGMYIIPLTIIAVNLYSVYSADYVCENTGFTDFFILCFIYGIFSIPGFKLCTK